MRMTFTGCLLHSAGFIPGCQCSKRSTRHGPRTRHGAPALDGCARSRMLAIPPAWEQRALILAGTPRCGGRSRPPQEDTRCSVEESPHRRGAESGRSPGARQAAHTLRRHTGIRAWGGDPRGASCRARRPGWRPWSITPTAAWCSAGECQGSVPSTSTLPPSGRCNPAALNRRGLDRAVGLEYGRQPPGGSLPRVAGRPQCGYWLPARTVWPSRGLVEVSGRTLASWMRARVWAWLRWTTILPHTAGQMWPPLRRHLRSG